MLVTFNEILAIADKGGFAIPAFNVYNMETTMGMIAAAEEAKAIIRELFGEGCAKRGLVELNDGIIQALCSLADLMGRRDISSVTVQLPGVCKVNMKLTGYAIKVERVEGRKYSDVAGEQ